MKNQILFLPTHTKLVKSWKQKKVNGKFVDYESKVTCIPKVAVFCGKQQVSVQYFLMRGNRNHIRRAINFIKTLEMMDRMSGCRTKQPYKIVVINKESRKAGYIGY